MNAPLSPQGSCTFALLVDALLPNGGCLLTLVNAYFDESIGRATVTDEGEPSRKVPVLCIAGYLMEAESAKLLAAEWQTVLDRYCLPYFHMVDCAHGNGAFKGLREKRRLRTYIAAQMMGLIKRYTIQGVSVCVNIEQFDEIMPKHPLLGTPYTFCAHVAIAGVQHWIREAKYRGDVAYFFETGNASQRQANGVMHQVFSEPELREASRYAAHGFVEKRKSPPIQAADLLAWQFYTDVRRQMERVRPNRRGDFVSLLEHPHHQVFVTPTRLIEMARGWATDLPPRQALMELYFGTDKAKKIIAAASPERRV